MLAEGQLTGVLNATSRIIDADAELMLRFQAGEVAGFEGLVSRYRQPLLSFVYRMVQNSGACEELVQETFLRVYVSRARYRPTARFSTWLYRIASRLALNYLRDHRHERHAQPLEEPWGDDRSERDIADRRQSIEVQLLEQEKCRQIRRCIGALNERQRAAVILHKYHEMDYREIAAVLKLTESATKSLLFRAYEKLRQDLKQWLPAAGAAEQGNAAG